MKRVKGGLIISAAGIDGCGKTTQLFRIATYLANRDYDVVRTSAISENCTEVGRRIGAIMTDPDLDGILPDESEATLMIAARVENWRNVIRPALEDGKIVVSDRFQTCFAIYQDLDFQVAKSSTHGVRAESGSGLGNHPRHSAVQNPRPARYGRESTREETGIQMA